MDPVPDHHFVKAATVHVPVKSRTKSAPRASGGFLVPLPSDAPSSGSQSVSHDFVAAAPLFQFVVPPRDARAAVQSLLSVRPSSDQKMPRLGNSQGKLSNICLPSSCQAPFNSCATGPCRTKKQSRIRNQSGSPAPEFVHVDLALSSFKDQPEEYWVEIVQFLTYPGAAAVVQPSEALKALTPGAYW